MSKYIVLVRFLCYFVSVIIFLRKVKQYMEQKSIAMTKEKLNKAIAEGADYSTIYSISLELDELIAEYYVKRER